MGLQIYRDPATTTEIHEWQGRQEERCSICQEVRFGGAEDVEESVLEDTGPGSAGRSS